TRTRHGGARGSLPEIFHVDRGDSWLSKVRRTTQSTGFHGNIFIRATRTRNRIAHRDLSLAASRQHVGLSASAPRSRRVSKGHGDRAFPVVQSNRARLRLWR